MRWLMLAVLIPLAGCLDGADEASSDAEPPAQEPVAASAWTFSCDDTAGIPSMEQSLLGSCASSDGRVTFALPAPHRVEAIEARVELQPVVTTPAGPFVRLLGTLDGIRWESLVAAGAIEDPPGTDLRAFELEWAGSMRMSAFRIDVSHVGGVRLDESLAGLESLDIKAHASGKPAAEPAPVHGRCDVLVPQQEAPPCVSGPLHLLWIPAPVEREALQLRAVSSHASQATCPTMPESDILVYFPVRVLWSSNGVDWTELETDYYSLGVPGGDWHEAALDVDHAVWFAGMAAEAVLDCPGLEPRLSTTLWWFA